MHRPISKKTMLAGLAAAGVLAIAVPAVALAEDGTSPSPSTSSSTGEQQRDDRRNDFAEKLAKELGVTTEQVTTALDKIREENAGDRPSAEDREKWAAERREQLAERLAQAVKDGKLTQEQADAITKAVESGVFPGGDRGGRHGGWHGGAPQRDGK